TFVEIDGWLCSPQQRLARKRRHSALPVAWLRVYACPSEPVNRFDDTSEDGRQHLRNRARRDQRGDVRVRTLGQPPSPSLTAVTKSTLTSSRLERARLLLRAKRHQRKEHEWPSARPARARRTSSPSSSPAPSPTPT